MIGRRPVLVGLLLVLLAGTAQACGSAEAASGPPEINYGRDICIHCNMIISEARFAAAYRLPDGTEKKFDDLGGLLIHGHETGDLETAAVWVHDYETEEWLQAPAGFYVPTHSAHTPMGYGVVAFSDHGRAAEFADGVAGEVIEWDVVLQLPTAPGYVGHELHEDHGSGSPTAGSGEEADHDHMHDQKGETE